jgi:acetyl-CoA carboxylase biotin carboxylase subunit
MFKKILIANRGEIAVRVIKACQELNITTVAIHSEVDSAALHVEMADESYEIGSPKSYLNHELILEVAKQAKADAIHPGYGFLSENAEFARKCSEQGIVFIGPSPAAIKSMGDKAVARDTMIKAKVPVVPGSGGPISGTKEALQVAGKVGYPVLVKAAAGGGGRGMRVAQNKNEILEAVRSAQSEALSCFGSSDVYIEKYLDDCRHIEYQILADSHGNVFHLGERDCSVQRRNQKLIEEAPANVLTPEQRRKMGEVAVAAARAVNYVGAGTVEFLFTTEGDYYFMEMNTRVQVEHPVTELITGIDIVKEQIRVAAGEPLDFAQEDVVIRGHAIECRINAEDPEINFMPCPGQVTAYRPPSGFGVRVESAVYPGYHISPYYDSMIGKLVVWGRTRDEAVARMKRSLKEFIIEGVTTTIPFHLLVFENEQFLSGDVYTNFIRKHIEGSSDGEDQGKIISLAKIKGQLANSKGRSTAYTGITPESLAVLSAAVTVYSSSRGQNLAIKDIQPAEQPKKDDFTPWRLLGINQLLQGRGLTNRGYSQ